MTLSLTACFWDYDRTLPLIRGLVPVEGCELACTVLRPEECFARAFGPAEFDVTELSFSNTVTAVSKGDFPYVLIPVFLSRAFRHSAIFVRSDRGIERPEDLKGKIIGAAEYDMTAAVVARGFLRDIYGIEPQDLRWRLGEAERTKDLRFPFDPPPGVEIEILPPGRSLEDRLLAGELDAVLALRRPGAGDPRVRPLFADPIAEERDYFRQTRIFPIMHAVGVRKTLVAAHPSLPARLYAAFAEAKARALSDLAVIQAAKVTLPWPSAVLAQAREALGDDFWPYGLAANRATLETQLRWSREDGLQARKVTLDELFAAV